MSRHAASEPGPPLPETIGPYRIQGRVGKGGMGEVYRGYDSRLERLVAVKRVKPGTEDPAKARRRFRREARAMARLSHPAIVQIYDVVEDDGGDWIVMELVEGRSLRELLAGGPLAPDRVAHLGRGVAEGLAAAHTLGLVHRDLKAGNVMVTDDGTAPDCSQPGRVKILDFGIAKQIGQQGVPLQTPVSAQGLSEQGQVIGTVTALSPEQALGRSVDHRSDLFSLGTLLYEMLTGVSPFRGENAVETLTRICTFREQPAQSLNPAVPEALGQLVGCLLRKDRERRPQTALAVSQALASFIEGSADAIARLAASDELSTTMRAGLSDSTVVADSPASLPSSAPIGGSPSTLTRESNGPVLLTLLVSDLVNSTRIVEQLGDERAARLFGEQERAARELLGEHGGREIDSADGFLFIFERPLAAVRYAFAYHDALAAFAQDNDLELAARVGIHLGEVVLRHNPPSHVAQGAKPLGVEGLAKPFTARLMSLATGGQTLLSRGAFDVARRAAQGALPQGELSWLAHGAYVFKGIEGPVEVFEVGREGAAPLEPPADSEKAWRAAGDDTILGWRPATDRGVPQRGSWALVRKLGEGGFGEVWLARHGKTGERRVFKFCFEAGKLRALQREVTLFRLLKETLGDRDDITHILDWNFDEAPYFVEIEFTASGSLVDWASKQGGIERVPMPVRLELVAQVAEALAAAHSVAVLHKDVKPSNILIDIDREGRARAQITDFGIGRITEKDRLDAAGITALGMSQGSLLSAESPGVGTRLYMAPEVLEGKPASIQADLYSLGVVLYQLVVGDLNRALAPGWRRDVDDELLAEDIAALVDRSPRRRLAHGRGLTWRLRELETRRAAHAEAEADRRALERARWRRKVLTAVAATALVVVAVVLVFAVQTALARREAERSRDRAEKLITFMLGDLRPTLESVGRLDAMGETADEILDYFRSLDEEDVTDDALARHAEALRQIGQVRHLQGKLEKAMTAFHEAEELAASLAARDPANGDWQSGLADSRFWIGQVLLDRGDLAGAQEAFEEQLKIYQDLAARQPDNTLWQSEMAMGHTSVGEVMAKRGDLDAAAEHHNQRLEIFDGLVRSDPADHDLRLGLARSHLKLGEVLEDQGALEAALEQYRANLDILQGLIVESPDNAVLRERLGTVDIYVALAFQRLGDIEVAGEHYRSGFAEFEKLAALDSSNVHWQRGLANSYRHLARLLRMEGKHSDAMTQARQSLEIFEGLAAKNPDRVANPRGVAEARLLIAELRNDAKDTEAALAEVGLAMAHLEELAAARPEVDPLLQRRRTQGYTLLARILVARGEAEAAEAAWLKAVAAIEPLARDSSDVEYLDAWLRPLLGLGRRDTARQIVDRLLTLGYRDPDFVELCRRHGLFEEADAAAARRRQENG